jgi:NADH-quinone oxidoreductase subunit M
METNQKVVGLEDMDMREIVTLLPMIILVFWIGIYPDAFLSFMHPSVENLVKRLNSGGQEMTVAGKIVGIIR